MLNVWHRELMKKTVIPVLHRTGLTRRLDRQSAGSSVLALNYHCVDPIVFRSHAKFLSTRVQMVDPADIDHEVSRAEVANRPRVVLTFDDGYANFVHRIHPILEQYGMQAIWFVPTDFFGSAEGYWFDRVRVAIKFSKSRQIQVVDKVWRLHRWGREFVANEVTEFMTTLTSDVLEAAVTDLLIQTGLPPTNQLEARRIATEDEIRSVDGRGVCVASHSRTHRNLPALNDDDLNDELRGSKQTLEALLNREVEHFAFPSGDYDDRVVARLHESGYRWGWTTDPGFVETADLPFRIPRVLIDDRASDAVLSAKMSSWMHRAGVIH